MVDQVYVDGAMQENKVLMQKLQEFNLKYAKYVKCSRPEAPTPTNTCASTDLTCCSPTDATTDLNVLKNDLITEIDNYRVKGNILYGNIASSPDQYSTINTNYGKVKELRNELDIKMRELYNIDGNLQNNSMLQYDSVMYTGILFSILATTILYYTFTRL